MDDLAKLKLITKIIREAREDLALDNLRAFAKEKLRESEQWRKIWVQSITICANRMP